jgi:signal peptidase I
MRNVTSVGARHPAPDILLREMAAEVVRKFGRLRLRVTGTSMIPSVRPGDLLVIQRADLHEVSPGEIVLFVRSGRLFAHRAVSKFEKRPVGFRLVTRGDRLLRDDSPVSPAEFLGRVCAIERGTRQIDPRRSAYRWAYPLSRFLRYSDRATFLFVRLTSLWGKLVARGAGEHA